MYFGIKILNLFVVAKITDFPTVTKEVIHLPRHKFQCTALNFNIHFLKKISIMWGKKRRRKRKYSTSRLMLLHIIA